MNNFEEIFALAKTKLKIFIEEEQKGKENIDSFRLFFEEIQSKITNEISEFLKREDIYKLAVLLCFLKKMGVKYEVSNKLDLLINVLETLPTVVDGTRYQEIPLIDSITIFEKANYDEMKALFLKEF